MPYQRSFLKWVGGKGRLIGDVLNALPTGQRLIEPFAGSGVVFLNARYSRYWLNDANTDLMLTYQELRHRPLQVIESARSLFTKEMNSAQAYIDIRERFNAGIDDSIKRTALFLYLNRHSYNGVMRYNKSGQFNTPFGRYDEPYFPANELFIFAEKLRANDVQISRDDFRVVLMKAGQGDVVYCDPPYIPLSTTANFSGYTAEGFSEFDHEELIQLATTARDRGAVVVISNHDTAHTRRLFHGAKLKRIAVQRSISCKSNERKIVKELLAVYR